MKSIYKILLASAAAMLLAACHLQDAETLVAAVRTEAEADSMAAVLRNGHPEPEEIKALGVYFTGKDMHDTLIRLFRPVFKNCLDVEDWRGAASSGAYIANSYYAVDRIDSTVYYLLYALEADSLSSGEDRYLSGMIQNLAAIVSLKSAQDQVSALSHYFAAYRYVQEAGDTANMAVVLDNISVIFSQRGDTAGLRYAREALRLSRRTDSDDVKSRCMLSVARQYCIRNEYDRAVSYVDSSLYLSASDSSLRHHRTYAYMLYGDILRQKGDYSGAIQYYKKAESSLTQAGDLGIDIQICRSIGDLLKETGSYEEALGYYEQGLERAERSHNAEHVYTLLLRISEVYEELGDVGRAFDCYKQYNASYDSVFNIENERKFGNMRMQYEQSRYMAEMQRMEIETLKAQRKFAVSLLVTVLVLLSSFFLWLLYRRKNRMFADLTRQYLNYRERIEEQLAVYRNRKSRISEADQDLFSRLEAMMREQGLYRNKQLSLEMAADMLGSTAAKVSKCVNHYAGCQFPAYVNEFRIKDAVARLSDSQNKELLKAVCDDVGYATLSTFYRAFIKETGVSPSKFREEMLRLHKKAVRFL